MSTVSETIRLQYSYQKTIMVVRKAVVSFSSLVEKGTSFEIKDNVQRTAFSTTWPAKVKIEFEKSTNDMFTDVILTASNFGMGPIQKKECRSKLGAVKSAILVAGQESNQSNNSSSPADEVMKLKQLLDAGVLTIEEFEKKKRQLLDL